MEKLKELYEKGKRQWLDGLHEEALESYLSIVAGGREACAANMNAAVILTTMGRYEEAERRFKEVLKNQPNDRELLFNYSLHLLARGRMTEGLRLYENRSWNIRPPGKEWDGGECGTLLVVPEQGNGDIIQFARFLPEARKKCKKMIVMCFGPLVRLVESMGTADEVIEFNPGDEFVESEGDSSGEVPYDRFARIMSLPHLLGTDRISPDPYMQVPEEIKSHWAGRMRGEKMKVGVCWRGHRRAKEDSAAIDSRRSIPMETFRPLLDVAGVDFYSLQKDAEEGDERLINLMPDSKDFMDTAAIMESLDLVVTVDTAVAHLAGSIGKPTWILNRKDSCWRWGGEGESTVWYGCARLFRQDKVLEWVPVVERVKEELRLAVDKG